MSQRTEQRTKRVLKRWQKVVSILFVVAILVCFSGCGHEGWILRGSFTIEGPQSQREAVTGTESEIDYKIEKLISSDSEIEVEVRENKTIYEVGKLIQVKEVIKYDVYEYGRFRGGDHDHKLCQAMKKRAEELKSGKIPPCWRDDYVPSCPEEAKDIARAKARFNNLNDIRLPYRSHTAKAIKRKSQTKEGKATDSTESFIREKESIPEREAQNIRVKITPGELFSNPTTRTDRNGSVVFIFAEFPYNFAFSKEEVEKKIKSSRLVSEIKLQFRNNLLDKILQQIEESKKTIIVETCEESTESDEKINDERTTQIRLYQIPEEKIYGVLEGFINKEINSKIKNTQFQVFKLPNLALEQVMLELETDTTKTRLAGKYFSGSLLKFAIDTILPFETSMQGMLSNEGFKLHTPSSYLFKVGHLRWNVQFAYQDGKIANPEITSIVWNWAKTKADLEKNMLDLKIIKEIKPAVRNRLLAKMLEKSTQDDYKIKIKTSRWPSQEIRINGRFLSETVIQKVLKNFIDQEINSKIKETVIIVQEFNSHAELSDVKMDMKIDAPSKENLAGNYFSGDLLKWAQAQIKDYRRGKSAEYTNRQGTIRFAVYTPSKFKFETKHLKYHAYEDATTFEDGNLTKVIRIIDIGQKLRVEKEEKKGGTLIEK